MNTVARLTRAYASRRALLLVPLVLGAGALAGVAILRSGGWTIAAGALAVLLAGWAVRLWLRRPTAAQVVAWLDRSQPTLEDSADLLLTPEAGLSGLEAVQRTRVERRLSMLELRLPPDRDGGRAALTGMAILAVLAGAAMMPGKSSNGIRMGDVVVHDTTSGLAIDIVSVATSPPSYTGQAGGTAPSPDLDVPEGTRVRWEARLTGPARAALLITTAGDTVALAAQGSSMTATLVARRSMLYRLQALGDSQVASTDDHRLSVRTDRPPSVVVLRPPPRRTFAPSERPVATVHVRAGDDYGVQSALLVATITTGQGENVRFRVESLPLPVERAGSGATGRLPLDLGALGMGPGDELYFHVSARDSRPAPQEGRSETVYLALADTAAPTLADFGGVAIGAEPEYFRSQRQIIIDTERLIAERPTLDSTLFRERANAIGMDQGLLRLRYGQFTGEEFEDAVGDDEAHDHDNPENATLLSTGVRAKLKAAITEMWEAELRLRTYRPEEALPFERRALELLKEVQQDSRAYVRRAGFEPPPLEAASLRLGGDLAGIRSSSDTRTLAAGADGTAPLRRALGALDADLAAPALLRALTEAGDALAARAVADPARHLDGLRLLRRLTDSTRAGVSCSCREAVRQALLAALPEPQPGGTPGRASALGARYLDALRAAP